MRTIFASLLACDPGAYRANPLSQRFLENIEADVLKQDAGALFVLLNGISSIEIADQLDQIRTPCYLLAGSDDPVVPWAQSLVLADKIPNARLVAFQNVGHMPFIESPEAYFEALEQALAELAAGSKAFTTKTSGDEQ